MNSFWRWFGAIAARNWVHVAMASLLVVMMTEPALAQNINLSPVQNFLQGLVDQLTGPLGMVAATLALVGVFITWFFGIIDFRQAVWVIIAIAGIGGAPVMVAALWGGGN